MNLRREIPGELIVARNIALLYFGVVWPAFAFAAIYFARPELRAEWREGVLVAFAFGMAAAAVVAIACLAAAAGSWQARRAVWWLSAGLYLFGFSAILGHFNTWQSWALFAIVCGVAPLLEPRFLSALDAPGVKQFIDDGRTARSFQGRQPLENSRPGTVFSEIA